MLWRGLAARALRMQVRALVCSRDGQSQAWRGLAAFTAEARVLGLISLDVARLETVAAVPVCSAFCY